MAGADHWDERYRTVGPAEVSWYESRPSVTLDLFDALGVSADDSVIDVGGGASTLVDHLLERGHRDLAVLDLSSVALTAARERLGHPEAVTWICGDLLGWDPPRRWSVWHDRAVLHFLCDEEAQRSYVELLHRAVEPGGAVVVGVFAEDGPSQCSALPVRRYAADELRALLGDVEVVDERRELHRTPGGAGQSFTWLAGRLPLSGGVTR